MLTALTYAKEHNRRLPGKHFLEIGGVPLIEHTFRYITASPLVDHALFLTDSESMAQIAEKYGAHVIEESDELRHAKNNYDLIVPLLGYYAKNLGNPNGHMFGKFVANNLVFDDTLIERSYEAMLGGAEYATSATINEMFAVKRGKDGYVEYFANDPDDLKRGENYAEEYCQNSGVVLFRWPYPEAGAVAKAALIPTKLYDVIEVQDPVSLAVARGVYEHRFAATRPRLVI